MAEAFDFSEFYDYFKILEVTPDTDIEIIKKSYRKLILDWHPDKRPESPTKSGTKMFQLINDAWDCLKDAEKREEYEILWREYHKQKLMPFERAELARKEGNEFYKRGQISARENNIPQALNHYQAAIERYSEGIDAGTNDHRLYSNRALCYAVLRDWTRAKRDAHQVVSLRANFMKGWFTLVRAYIMEQNLDQAQKQLTIGITNCDSHPDLLKLQEEIDAKRQEQEYNISNFNNKNQETNTVGKQDRHNDTSDNRSNPNTSNPNSARGIKSKMNQTIANERPTSYREYRDVTPSRTPPTPLLQARGSAAGMAAPPGTTSGGVGLGTMGFNASMGRGMASTMGTQRGWGVDLEGTGQFGGTMRGNTPPPGMPGMPVDLEGTANFGRSIGYSRTPPRNASPGPLPGPPRHHTPPRDPSVGAVPHRVSSHSRQNPSMGNPGLGSTLEFGRDNPLNNSYSGFNNTGGFGTGQYNVAAAARQRSRTPTKDHQTPPKDYSTPPPVRAPSLRGAAERKTGNNTPPRHL